jgi:hypothetical protein
MPRAPRAPRSVAVAAILALAACARPSATLLAPSDPIVPGAEWLDTEGRRIEAHGGGVLRVGDRWFWYGEDHRLGGGNRTGIAAYSSTDLRHWTPEGIVLPKDSLPELFRDRGVAERPKVIHNARTGQYVMWMHLDANRYQEASAGVAVADAPAGPFRVVRIFRPVAYDYGYSREEGTLKERERGNSFRDMALFRDDDGSAYVFYSSESNASLYAVRLSDDYTDIARPAVRGRTWERVLPDQRREAPAPFKAGGKYHLITSGLTGWAPNPARHHVADRPLGPWTDLGNPAVGPESATTFRSQSAFVLPLPEACARCFVFMADRWEARALQQSTYVWLPFVVGPDGSARIAWRDRWDLGAFRALGAGR